MTMLSTIRCRNCNQNSRAEEIVKSIYPIKRCENCNGWSLVQSLEKFNAQEIYSEEYFQGTEYLSYEKGMAVHKKNFRRKLKIISQSISENPAIWKLLELGSANGAFLNEMREVGCKESVGIEISNFARKKAIENGLNVYHPDDPSLKDYLRKYKPEVLVAWDVWEHLEDPAKIFKDWIKNYPSIKYISITTVDCGSFIPKIKKTNWRQFHPPSHLNYPTRKSFEIFMKECGFKIVRHQNFGYTRPLAEYLVALFPSFRKKIFKYDWFFKVPLYFNLFDSQIVIAEREVQ